MHAHTHMCTDVCVCMCVCVCVYVCTCVPAYIVQLLISLRLFFSFSDLVFIVQQIVKVKLVILCYSYCAYSCNYCRSLVLVIICALLGAFVG